MGRQVFADALLEFPPADLGTVANTVTVTNLWDPAIWSSISAFDTRAGKMWELRAGGVVSCTGTPTIIFNPRWGVSATPASNIALGASRTITLGSGLANAPWFLTLVLGCRSTGVAAATGTVVANGQLSIQGIAAAIDQDIQVGGTNITTAPWNVGTGVSFDVTWGTAAVGNTITARWAALRALN